MTEGKNKTTRPKRIISIRIRLIIVMVVLLGLMVFAFFLMNYTFLPSYYERSKESLLTESYDKVNAIVESEQGEGNTKRSTISADSRLEFEIMEENNSVNLYIFRVVNFFGTLAYNVEYPNATDDMQKSQLEKLTYDYLTGAETADENARSQIEKSESYTVYKAYDSRIGSYYMELFGTLESGSFIYLRTNYQSMDDSIAIFNQFLFIIGLVVLVLGVVVMIFLGNRFARPIVQITDVAKRMSELDFDARYPVKTRDEIGVLGHSINVLSERLESTIAELKSANNQLQRDIERKDEIDRERREFLSNVSHELKTPIALIQGYAEGLQDNVNDDSADRDFYCEVIVDEAQKMNKIVQKLLTLNQIEFGHDQVEFARFDLVSLIGNLVQSVSLLADQKGANIAFDRDYPPMFVWADEYMTEEVVTNYLSNAINHADFEKQIRISLEDRGGVVRVRVFNTGLPIPEEDLDKVWDKFYKVDKARTREYGGSGVGLSIVKAVMESMNRDCGVQNRDGGVEFWFELDAQK